MANGQDIPAREGEGARTMFNWTQERTFAAMAAGIAEVVDAYNTAYAFATTDPTIGPDGGNAHGYALLTTTKWLRAQEAALFERNVERVLDTLGIAGA